VGGLGGAVVALLAGAWALWALWRSRGGDIVTLTAEQEQVHESVDKWVRVRPHRLQRLARLITRRPGKLLFNYRAFGAERIPAEGGFIIAPNHGGWFDSAFFAFFAHGHNRTIRFMAKYQVLEWPIVGPIVARGGAFPVRKGHGQSRAALEVARRILQQGHGLMMFMEGRMVRDTAELGEPHRGLAVLALQSGVPVVPVAGWGIKPAWAYGRKRRPWRRPRVTVVWGEPMYFPKVEEPSMQLVERVRDVIWAEVTRLHGFARQLDAMESRPPTWNLPPREKSDVEL
jgi:1-acyl-sn-glycerol-3-phosphate acyltransferase